MTIAVTRIMTTGLDGRSANQMVLNLSRLYISMEEKEDKTLRPGGSGGGFSTVLHLPEREEEEIDHSKVDLSITVRWPFARESLTYKFELKRKWANVIVNRRGNITNFVSNIKTTVNNFKEKITTRFK